MAVNYPGVMIIGTGAKIAPQLDTSQMVFVEVALIDRTHQGLTESPHPSAYQVQELPLDGKQLPSADEMAQQMQDDAFVMMGKVERVDKEERRIYLGNGTIVCYKHLIIAAGSRHTYVGHDNVNEFRTGIQALGEAMRLRKMMLKVSVARSVDSEAKESEAVASFAARLEASELEKPVQRTIQKRMEGSGEGRAVGVGSQMPKVFCEVQAASSS